MTPIATVDDLIHALLEAQDATTPVTLSLTSAEYDLSSSTFEPDERFGSEHMQCALPHITKNVTIDIDSNPALPSVKIYQDNPLARLLYVAQGASLTLNHLELTSGDVGSYDTGGGAIYNDGTLTVRHCQFHHNKSNYGGAIVNTHGHTDIFNCDFYDNEADWGGALYNASVASGCVMTVTDSRIANNKSKESYGIGGGITNFGTLTVTHCMIENNDANQGGGIANWATNAQATIKNSHITRNKGSIVGGGVLNDTGTLQMEKSTLIDNTSPSGKQAYKNNGTVSLDKVSLPDDYTNSEVSTGITVTTPLPSWHPSFLMVRQSDKSLVPTYQYNRQKAAERAIQFSRDNFANFPQNSVTSPVNVVGFVDYLASTRRRNYSSVLLHDVPVSGQPRTGSAIFISEMIHYGGLPMTIDSGDNPNSPNCTNTTGPYSVRGWRYCPSPEKSATQNWKYHPGIVSYFDSLPGGDLIGTVTLTQIQSIIWTTENNGFGISGNLKNTSLSNSNNAAMIDRFNPDLNGDLANIAVGDYLYIESHGFLVVGWGQLKGTMDGISQAFTNGVSPTRSYPNLIPYVADFCYGTDGTPDGTGWLQDPRPRPFYATATRVFQENLRSDQTLYLKAREVQRNPPNTGAIEPVYDNFDATEWKFYKLPSTFATSLVGSDRLYFMG